MLDPDATQLIERLQRDFPSLPGTDQNIWSTPSAAKIIDCVLSLRMKYTRVVAPRVERFVRDHPEVCSCAALAGLIRQHPSPAAFSASVLNMKHATKGAAILAVADHLIGEQARFEGSEEERLSQWARWARPGDFIAFVAPGFGIAGFQYLRILFGADTIKPDVHILRYLQDAIGHPVAEGPAVYLIERVAGLMGASARGIDRAIWERAAAAARVATPTTKRPG
jgi:hypothetical protein